MKWEKVFGDYAHAGFNTGRLRASSDGKFYDHAAN